MVILAKQEASIYKADVQAMRTRPIKRLAPSVKCAGSALLLSILGILTRQEAVMTEIKIIWTAIIFASIYFEYRRIKLHKEVKKLRYEVAYLKKELSLAD